MGLDIMVYIPIEEQNEAGSFSEFVVNDVIDLFKKHLGESVIKNKINTYYDFEAIGITEDRYEWWATDYSKDPTVWEFGDIESPFYKLEKKIRDEKDMIDLSKITEEIRKELLDSGILEYYNKEGYTVSPDDNLAVIHKNGKTSYYPVYEYLHEKSKLYVNDDEIPTVEKEDKVVYGKEIGYQRKGVNGLFYDECEDVYVFTKERLQYICDHYILEESKDYFKKNIIDKHIDGKTFVVFS